MGCDEWTWAGLSSFGHRGLTSVLGKESRERAFLQKACGVVFLGERLLRPVVYAVVVPRLVLAMLRHHQTRTQHCRQQLASALPLSVC